MDTHPRTTADRGNASFFGRITASSTHELSNVVAIIRELSGLMGDLLAGAAGNGVVNVEKFQSIVGKIEEQTVRGNTIIKRLNRFAHSADVPVVTVKLNDILTDITDFSRRFAVMKNIELETQLPADSPEIGTNPFLLMRAVFTCIDISISSSDTDARIVIGCEKKDTGAQIYVTGPCINIAEQHSEKNELIDVLMKEINGAFGVESQGTNSQRCLIDIQSLI
ncbi:hypothetical protein ACFL6I_03995 [candidate division KSB1 bacterium]